MSNINKGKGKGKEQELGGMDEISCDPSDTRKDKRKAKNNERKYKIYLERALR